LAEKYGVTLLFWPKFHYELNPIESVWCYIKQYVRKRTDQTYDKMIRLIEEAKQQFKSINLNAKLWRRFWQAINMYDKKLPYVEIIQLLYGCRTAENQAHRRIYNTILLKQ
jgi:transposase